LPAEIDHDPVVGTPASQHLAQFQDLFRHLLNDDALMVFAEALHA